MELANAEYVSNPLKTILKRQLHEFLFFVIPFCTCYHLFKLCGGKGALQ